MLGACTLLRPFGHHVHYTFQPSHIPHPAHPQLTRHNQSSARTLPLSNHELTQISHSHKEYRGARRLISNLLAPFGFCTCILFICLGASRFSIQIRWARHFRLFLSPAPRRSIQRTYGHRGIIKLVVFLVLRVENDPLCRSVINVSRFYVL